VEYAFALILLLVFVALVVGGPLRRGVEEPRHADEERDELEAAKEAKYREIRDAELDFRMGKLSEEDWQATDAELRAQAIEILKALDRLDAR
jgi:hypothetical protein